MNSKERRQALIDQLQREEHFISLPHLIAKLQQSDKKPYPERTVRRWLSELVQEGKVLKLGNKKATQYKLAAKAIDETHSINQVQQIQQVQESEGERASSFFQAASAAILAKVRRPLFERQPIAYQEEWLNAYQPNISCYIPQTLQNQLYLAGKRSHEQDPAGTYAHQIFNRLLIDLSYNSSRLEGNTYSLLDTERLILKGASAEGKLDEEKVMILNHKEAIRYLVDQAPRLKVTWQTICTLHYLLADGLVESKYAGKVRDHNVRIGGSVYMPFEDSNKLQQLLDQVAEKGSLIQNPFEQSLFLLIHISYLQAFCDVNKRTARLAANISLIQRNLVPLSFNEIEREDYMSAMIAVYELQEVGPLVDLYTFSYLRTCAAYGEHVKAIAFDEVRVRYRQQRRAIVREVILHQIANSDLEPYVKVQTQKILPLAPLAVKHAFFEDVIEDLKEMDVARLAGLGISPDELARWLDKRDS